VDDSGRKTQLSIKIKDLKNFAKEEFKDKNPTKK
jgi:hypothetical protein